jgi:hypothetical protein
MIDADRYWAGSGLPTGSPTAPLWPNTQPTSGITAKQLDGGCLLYRLPVRSPRSNVGTYDDNEASAKAAISPIKLARQSPDCQ